MMFRNGITEMFGIRYPIVQGGMVWCAGWKLASAVSKAGGLGLIGAGSMDAALLHHHIKQCKDVVEIFGVNIPLLYKHTDELIQVILSEKVPIVFTSAGNPKLYTKRLKAAGIRVVHVVSSLTFALKAQEAGVDAIVAEGFEAGGHNGREETTTLVLLQLLQNKLNIPVLAAGGIYNGNAMLAAMALGAQGVQIGSRFAACAESSAHPNFKERIRAAKEGETMLTLKQLAPVRMLKNDFYFEIENAIAAGSTVEKLQNIVGKGRSKKGIFEGDIQQGELEIGQVAACINQPETAAEIIQSIWAEFLIGVEKIKQMQFSCDR